MTRKLLAQFFSAEFLAAALVVEVGFLVGAWAGRMDGALTPLQWAGGAMAIVGAVLTAVLVHTWPKDEGGKARQRA